MHTYRWHDAGTYDAKKKTGGPNGSIRFKEELNRPYNKGLEKAVAFCGQFPLSSNLWLLAVSFDVRIFGFWFPEEVKCKHPRVSYADLYQVKT